MACLALRSAYFSNREELTGWSPTGGSHEYIVDFFVPKYWLTGRR
jgi:hypothetical protein